MKCKVIFVLIIYLCITTNSIFAQTQIKGHVTDGEGNPIASVSVLVKGTKSGTITDNYGNFSVEAGIGNTLIFSSVSYETKEIEIVSTSVNIQLSLQIKPLEQLVVSGNMTATKRKADISSVTILKGKDIDALPGFNLLNILEGVVPGVTVTTLGPGVGRVGEYFLSRIQVRGADIKVYVDGIVYAAGSNYLAMISKDDIDRIEVVRGPSAATLYGSGAMGGVMLVYTKKGRPGRMAIELNTSVGFQQSDYVDKPFQQMHSINFHQGSNNFSYVIGGSYKTQDAYLPKGSIKIGGGYANFTYTKGKFRFTLSNNYNLNKIVNGRAPIFENTSAESYYWTYKDSAYAKSAYKIHSTNISLNTSFQPTRWWTHNLVIGYSENAYRYYADPSVYTDTALIKYYNSHGDAYTAQQWDSKDRTPTIRYNNVINIGRPVDAFKMDIMTGIEYSNTKHNEIIYNNTLYYTTATGYSYQPNRVTGSPFYIYNREFTGAFLQSSSSLKDKYFLTAGLRYEKSNVSSAIANPRVGFTTNFEWHGCIIKPRVNWGRSITPPPYNFTHPQPSFGPFTFVGNPDIKSKQQSGGDLAIEIFDKKDKLKAEVVRYDHIIKNDFLIKRTPINNGTGLLITYSNIGKYAYEGWEFSAEYKIGQLKLAGNYSIIHATYIDSFIGRKTFRNGDKVDYIPNYAAGASINYTVPKLFSKADHFSFTISLTSSGHMIAEDSYQYLLDNAKWRQGNGPPPVYNYRETPGVTKFNLNLDYQFHSNMKFFVQAWNFTNNTTPDWDKSFPVPGASWIFGLNLNVNRLYK